MPKKPIDYSNTHFYKIVCKDTNIKDCYVGHTTDFTNRRYKHKYSCENPNDKRHNLYIYDFIRKNGCWENWTMIEIEKRNCENSLEARRIEREYIEQLNASQNCKNQNLLMKKSVCGKKHIWKNVKNHIRKNLKHIVSSIERQTTN